MCPERASLAIAYVCNVWPYISSHQLYEGGHIVRCEAGCVRSVSIQLNPGKGTDLLAVLPRRGFIEPYNVVILQRAFAILVWVDGRAVDGVRVIECPVRIPLLGET